ncbi:hypothetical protein JP74_21850 [Devosia sp. 17-2-E-8]|nr:hypothetical protein JP74_21850 [Devosia sp. 17-2-E-8]
MDIKTIEVAKLGLLIDIAARALDFDWEQDSESAAHADLNEAYQAWKDANGIEHVARDTPEWELMMQSTAEQYQAHEASKRKARNARKRLRTAVLKYRNHGK